MLSEIRQLNLNKQYFKVTGKAIRWTHRRISQLGQSIGKGETVWFFLSWLWFTPTKADDFLLFQSKISHPPVCLHQVFSQSKTTHLQHHFPPWTPQHTLTPCKTLSKGCHHGNRSSPTKHIQLKRQGSGSPCRSLAKTSQPACRQELIPHSVPRALILTRPVLHNHKLSAALTTSWGNFFWLIYFHVDALHPSTCSIFKFPRPGFK